MLSDAQLRAQLPHTLRQLDLPGLGSLYRGKVRDNYSRGDQIVMVTSDRISAFDHVLGTIPFKGEVLSRHQILEEVWDQNADVTTRTIDNFVLRLRKLIEPDPARPRYILSVPGTGYRFVSGRKEAPPSSETSRSEPPPPR